MNEWEKGRAERKAGLLEASFGVVQVGWSAAGGQALPASAVALLAAWTVGAGALAALAWRRVVAR